jgi:hypothetical protein
MFGKMKTVYIFLKIILGHPQNTMRRLQIRIAGINTCILIPNLNCQEMGYCNL